MKDVCKKHGEEAFVPLGKDLLVCKKCIEEAMDPEAEFTEREPVGFENMERHKLGLDPLAVDP